MNGDDPVEGLNEAQDGCVVGLPAAGTWKLRFNSDWQGYSKDVGHPSTNGVAEPGEVDGLPFCAPLSIGPYSALIFSQQTNEQDSREGSDTCVAESILAESLASTFT